MKFRSTLQKGLVSIALFGASNIVWADEAYLVVPNCLQSTLKNITHTVQAKQKTLSLIKLEDGLIDQVAKQAHKTKCGGFLNVSDKFKAQSSPVTFLQNIAQSKFKSIKPKERQIEQQEKVMPLLEKVEPKNIWHTLEELTSFDDRYSRGDNGREAAFWLQEQFLSLVKEAHRDDVKTYFVETGGLYKQPSLVTVLGEDLSKDAIVVGAHMDTLNYMKPGADDDGSGSSSLMEAARVILNADKLNRPVYFIWYSAEEMGLVGSQKVVREFVKKGIPVKSVMQLDMTGYRRNGSDKMWMIGDHVNKSLSKYVEELIHQYIGVDVGWSNCGYACSDHASWTQAGFASSFPVESRFGDENPFIHTGRDTMANVSVEHMANYSKLAVAFVVEEAS